jgi:hypothetical protein
MSKAMFMEETNAKIEREKRFKFLREKAQGLATSEVQGLIINGDVRESAGIIRGLEIAQEIYRDTQGPKQVAIPVGESVLEGQRLLREARRLSEIAIRAYFKGRPAMARISSRRGYSYTKKAVYLLGVAYSTYYTSKLDEQEQLEMEAGIV